MVPTSHACPTQLKDVVLGSDRLEVAPTVINGEIAIKGDLAAQEYGSLRFENVQTITGGINMQYCQTLVSRVETRRVGAERATSSALLGTLRLASSALLGTLRLVSPRCLQPCNWRLRRCLQP